MEIILVVLILAFIVLIRNKAKEDRAKGNQTVAAALREALPPELHLSNFHTGELDLWGPPWTGWVIYVRWSRFLGPFSLIAADIATDGKGTRWFVHVTPKWRSVIRQVAATVKRKCPYITVEDIDDR